MNRLATPLEGAFLLDLEPAEDERGSFVRLYTRDTFASWGISVDFAQCSVSNNPLRGTLRGMHYQEGVHAENKLVWCLAGRILDVIVDIRPESKTAWHWFASELAPSGPVLYVPRGFAHGFQTLNPNSVVQYHISEPYRPDAARGLRWDDPILGIPWPIRPPVAVSERDLSWPLIEG